MKIFLLALICSFFGASIAFRRVCYFASWSIYRQGQGHFEPEFIDASLCTHLIYSFIGLDEGANIVLTDPGNDVGDGSNGLIQRLHNLKNSNPNLKTMFAIGGGSFGSRIFSQVVNDPQRRQTFANNAAEFIRKYGYDGLDIDWEWPGVGDGSQPSDKQAFIELLQVFRTRFDQDGLLLSIASSAPIGSVEISYDIPSLSRYLDFVNIMTYDLHGPWTPITGHVSPLHFGDYLNNVGGDKTLYVEAIINNFLDKGSDAQKLNLGVPFYANTFTLADANNNGFGAPSSGPGRSGSFFTSPGVLGYNEVCFTQSQWTNRFDEQQGIPYSVQGDQWSGYDNERSLQLKVDFLKSKNLGGVMVWTIDMDDFAGACTGQKFPLANLLKNNLP